MGRGFQRARDRIRTSVRPTCCSTNRLLNVTQTKELCPGGNKPSAAGQEVEPESCRWQLDQRLTCTHWRYSHPKDLKLKQDQQARPPSSAQFWFWRRVGGATGSWVYCISHRTHTEPPDWEQTDMLRRSWDKQTVFTQNMKFLLNRFKLL